MVVVVVGGEVGWSGEVGLFWRGLGAADPAPASVHPCTGPTAATPPAAFTRSSCAPPPPTPVVPPPPPTARHHCACAPTPGPGLHGGSRPAPLPRLCRGLTRRCPPPFLHPLQDYPGKAQVAGYLAHIVDPAAAKQAYYARFTGAPTTFTGLRDLVGRLRKVGVGGWVWVGGWGGGGDALGWVATRPAAAATAAAVGGRLER